MSRFMFNRGGGEIPVPGNDVFTKILLHMDGVNGGTSFPDVNAGGSAHTWTAVGGVTTTTSTKKYGSASLQGNGSGYLESPASSDFVLGSNNFTIEGFINLQGNVPASQYDIAGYGSSTATNNNPFGISVSSTGTVAAGVEFTDGTGANAFYASAPVLDGAEHHFAFVRNGTAFIVYVDGIAGAVVGSSSKSVINSTTYVFRIGSQVSTGTIHPILGAIDEFRLSNGIARYTANFTPPTGPFS